MPTQNRRPERAGNRRLRRIIPLVGALIVGWVMAADQAKPAVAEQRPIVTVANGDDLAITAAINSLPDGGGIVALGTGTFSIKHPIIIDRDGIELRGQGAGTLLVLATQANCPVVIIGSASTPTQRIVRQVTVRELVIDGNRDEQNFECFGGHCDEQNLTALRNNGISVRGTEDILIENIVTRRTRSGGVVLEKTCRRIRIDGLESHDNEFDGLAAYETEDSTFTRLYLHHNRSAGFSFDWRFNRNQITNSIASENGSQGIFMRDSIGNTFERVKLQANGEQGIFMAETRTIPGTACRYNKFRTVTITGNKAHGIRINDASCTVNSLEDCIVTGNGVEDISLADFGQLQITLAGVTREFRGVAAAATQGVDLSRHN